MNHRNPLSRLRVAAALLAATLILPLGLAEAGVSLPVTSDRAGTIYAQTITVPSTGDKIVVQVFEPTQLQKGKTYPLVLQSHGYGGSRLTTPDAFVQKLIDGGYYVISIDERGFGASSGTVRVMDPDYEGHDLIAVLDWAENLPGLRRRSNGQMVVGSYGGSYGGMYQLLLYSADPQHRLRVLAPDITPHDLNYSLDSDNVIKSGWAAALISGGELPLIGLATGSDTPAETLTAVLALAQRAKLRQDTTLYEVLVNAVATNTLNATGKSYLGYHSMRYFCDGQTVGPQKFLLGTPDRFDFGPLKPPAADVLLTQGFRDTLFNFNDGLHNYECLKNLGGDVRLLTHQSGHILPVSLAKFGLEGPLDRFYTALTFPGFQDPGGTRSCGSMKLDDVQFAWFEEKLQNKTGTINGALKTGTDFCLSLAEGDAIQTHSVKHGGTSFAINSSTPQLNSVAGIAGSLLGNGVRDSVLLADQLLYTVPAGGKIIAGVPQLNVTLQGLTPLAPAKCIVPGMQLGCDPILFFAIGHRPVGQTRWDIIDDQITPVRGFGTQQIEMNGIAERLAPGEQVALLIYAFHAQYPITWSRDLLVPALKLSGTVQLPLLAPGDVVNNGV